MFYQIRLLLLLLSPTIQFQAADPPPGIMTVSDMRHITDNQYNYVSYWTVPQVRMVTYARKLDRTAARSAEEQTRRR